MEVLVEGATTSLFASKMNTDSNADGVVDGFTSGCSTGITAVFSVDDNAQSISITNSTSAGNARVLTTELIPVLPGTAYSVQALWRGFVNIGMPKVYIDIMWYDNADALISATSSPHLDIAPYWSLIKLENVTPPANAAYCRVALEIESPVPNCKGTALFRYVMLEEQPICGTYIEGTRDADIVSSTFEPLGDTWAVAFVVSPNWAFKSAGTKYLLEMSKPGGDGIKILVTPDGIISAIQQINSAEFAYCQTLEKSFAPNTILKVILSCSKDRTLMHIRPNNQDDTGAWTERYLPLEGINSLRLGSTKALNAYSFFEAFTLYRDKEIFLTEEARFIFDRMNIEMIKNGNFGNGSFGWELYNDTEVVNSRLKGVAGQISGKQTLFARQNIAVFPNNTYKIKAKLNGFINSLNTPYISVTDKDILGEYMVQENISGIPTADNQNIEWTVTTSAYTWNLEISCCAKGACTAYFDDISLQLVN